MIKHHIAKLEARFQIDPRDTLVTPADVEGWRNMGIVVPDCRPGGESMKHWLEGCSDEALHRFIELHEQGLSKRRLSSTSYAFASSAFHTALVQLHKVSELILSGGVSAKVEVLALGGAVQL